jgi:putative ABC transport system substrate-binding protein
MGRAQQTSAVRRIGMLMHHDTTDALAQSEVAAFVRRLRELGWTEGQNLRIDVRWTALDVSLARTYAAELIGLMPDIIVASATSALTALREATSTIPVVFLNVSDPVAQGFVMSMRQPGGNLTGFSLYEFSVGGKVLGLLKEAAPALARVAVLFNPDRSPVFKFQMPAIEAAAPTLGVQVTAMAVRATTDIEPAVQNFAREPNGGLMLTTDNFIRARFALIVEQVRRYRLPSVSMAPDFAKEGGLMDYGTTDGVDQFRQAAAYVDRILKGAKPTDLPVQAPVRYRLVINLKTAKALGLTIPLPLLGLADEVIE